MAALVTKQAHWVLSDDEAKKLAQALKQVMKYHQIPISPQMLAYLQLAGVSAVIYGPRVMISGAMAKQAKAQAKQKQAQVETLQTAQEKPAATMQFPDLSTLGSIN